jgi:hypothetical protein
MHKIIEYFYHCFNLYTLCLFVGFAVGFATAYSAVLWPPKKKPTITTLTKFSPDGWPAWINPWANFVSKNKKPREEHLN